METFTNFSLLTIHSLVPFHFFETCHDYEKINANSSNAEEEKKKEREREKQKIFNKAAYNYNPGKRRP